MPPLARRIIALVLRQRNEFSLARYRREASGFPLLFRLLNALLARGDEIPPDVARALECRAAEEHQPRRPRRRHRDAVAGTKYQELRRCEFVAGDVDLALGDVDRPFLMVGIEGRIGTGVEQNFGI